MSFRIFSPAFEEGNPIPREYTCDGSDNSPELLWDEVPANAKSFVLMVNDPDAPAGDWVHWIIYNIPAEKRGLQQNIAGEKRFPDGTLQGRNSWHQVKYGGPCPPGGTHRYFFKLYALDTMLNLEPGVERQEILHHMQGHILAEAQLMGTYTRNK